MIFRDSLQGNFMPVFDKEFLLTNEM